MKTTLKKTMAALSAAAVVAASAAVMAVPTSAAGVSLTMGSKTLTLAELKADNYEVTLPIGVTDKINSVGFGVTLGDGLSYVKLKGSVEGATVMAAASESGNFIFAPFAYASVPLEAVGGQIAEIKVKVSESAKPGDTFTLSIDGKDSDGVETSYKNGETGETGVPGSGAGTITIVEDPTEPTTEAPTTVVTEATTAAPTATPVAATTTAAKVATPTKPAKSTSSPKTGDALPVAGVAVAVAVIGGVALVAKKRK